MKYKFIIITLILILVLIFLIYIIEKNFLKKNKKQKIIFLTYGNDKFKQSRTRIANESKQLGIYDEIIVETDKTILNYPEWNNALKNLDFKNISSKNRGGGYWFWKSFIIYETMKKMNNNDILMYADAGCSHSINNKNE